ncbi:MAG: hypothetical protein M8353_05825 [ANME-2 cluster archaeon]|nr:hypothetical protein [ANME-2 cluster archaeon]
MSTYKPFTLFLIILACIFIPPTMAEDISIIDVYSDIDSADITLHSGGEYTDIIIDAELVFDKKVIATRQFSITSIDPDSDITKVTSWDITNPKEGFYRTRMTLFMDGSPLETRYFNFSYGWQALPGISIKDIVPDSRGISVILAPYSSMAGSRPVLTDIEYMLVDGDTVIYRTTDNRVTVVQATSLSKDWNVLLLNDHEYYTRVKARISTPADAVIARSEGFTAIDDARITELYRDETGASATVLGYSQVPFDGHIMYTVTQDNTVIESVREKIPLLTSGDDETIEVIWDRKLAAGIYGLSVEVIGNNGDVLDRWNTVIESEYDGSSDSTPVPTPTQTPGFGIFQVSLVMASLIVLSGRKDRHNG